MVANAALTLLAMRRSLLLTDESARHPFRASLPPHCLKVMPEEAVGEKRNRWSMQDLRDFLLAYCACFLAVSAFLL